jgi:hypothetical protein
MATARLAHRDGVRVAGQDAVELAASANADLGEHLAQVILDRECADEQWSPALSKRTRLRVAACCTTVRIISTTVASCPRHGARHLEQVQGLGGGVLRG